MVSFGKTKKEPPAPAGKATEQYSAVSARLRVGEQRYSELRKKVLLIEQNMLSNHRRAMNEIRGMQDDIKEIKHSIHSIEDKMITIVKELRLMASKEDMAVMKKYIELWNPVTFVTRDYLDKILEEKQGKKVKTPKV